MEISRCAQRLADERGLDGFTMDELAEAVGVSRRTLFNHVPSKIDAVLGEVPTTDDESLAEFASGGPSGDLLADMRTVGARVFAARSDDVDSVARVRRLLRGDPRLVKAVHDRLEEVAEVIAQVIVDREGGDFDPFTARVLARLSMCIFDTAVEEFLDDSSVSAEQHYIRVFDVATEFFNPQTQT